MGKYLRLPHTAQERRNGGRRSCIIIDGYRIKLRAKRNQNTLPTSYDDIWRRYQRSWKKQRKNQWKPNFRKDCNQ